MGRGELGNMRDEKGCKVKQGLMALSEGEAAPPPASSLVPVAERSGRGDEDG